MCLLAVLLLAGCVSGAEVSTITITGIDTPTTGATPDKAASTSTAGINLGTISWNTGSESTFNAGTRYTVTIPVTNKSGYTFANSLSATVNGKTASANKIGNTVVVSYQFDATATASPVSDIKCELEEPKASNTPAKTVTFITPTSGLKSTVIWSPCT